MMPHIVTHSFAIHPRFKRYFPALLRPAQYVMLHYADGICGIGEFAFLKSVHGQKGEHLLNELHDKTLLAKLPLLEKIDDDTELAGFFAEVPYPASYVLSMAHFHHRCLKKNAIKPATISLQALIVEDDPSLALHQSLSLVAKGFQTLKIKVNGTKVLQTIEKITTLLHHLPNRIRLRLDGNQSFTHADARRLVESIDMGRIDYFEEPTKNFAEWSATITEKLAADESYFSSSLSSLKQAHINHLIVRPSSFHDLFSLKKLIKAAEEMGFNIVLSHAFETAFTRDLLTLYLAEINVQQPTHGLYEWDFINGAILESLPFRLTTKDCLNRIKTYAPQ